MADFSADDLRSAIESSSSWRGVLRHLGLPESSSARLRAVRRRALELELDTSALVGGRTWTDTALVSAVAEAHSWQQVATILGLSEAGHGALSNLRRHAARLGLVTRHLEQEARPTSHPYAARPRAENLRKAGPMLAASWFTLCGYEVLWPLEPCRYDLGVSGYGTFERVQVKTTTHRPGGAAVVGLSSARRRGRVTYLPSEVDHFFAIDDDLDCYLIPAARVAGRHAISLAGYEAFRVATGGRFLTPPVFE